MEKAKLIYNGNVNLDRIASNGFNFFDESPMQKIISEASKKIREEQEQLIVKTIKEKTGVTIDPKEESERRFPRIGIEYGHNQENTYWWNDGTKEGLRIITFYYEPLPCIDSKDFFVGFKYR